ncbi:MAG: transposase [Burkholderiales bacterium]|nr:transposase [Burkholderiales bacterium]
MVQARERDAPSNVEPIDWKLITDLPVTSRVQAVEKIDWYAMRWTIETVHKILKSGCRAEDSRLRTAQRLANLIAIFCILSWRSFWLTMINRTAPEAPATIDFTPIEVELLAKLKAHPATKSPALNPSMSTCPIQLARLGGLLDPRLGPATGKHCHLAGNGPVDRHRTGLLAEGKNMWVKASRPSH